jgi:phosphatidylserine decarboxylase
MRLNSCFVIKRMRLNSSKYVIKFIRYFDLLNQNNITIFKLKNLNFFFVRFLRIFVRISQKKYFIWF